MSMVYGASTPCVVAHNICVRYASCSEELQGGSLHANDPLSRARCVVDRWMFEPVNTNSERSSSEGVPQRDHPRGGAQRNDRPRHSQGGREWHVQGRGTAGIGAEPPL